MYTDKSILQVLYYSSTKHDFNGNFGCNSVGKLFVVNKTSDQILPECNQCFGSSHMDDDDDDDDDAPW